MALTEADKLRILEILAEQAKKRKESKALQAGILPQVQTLRAEIAALEAELENIMK